LLKFLLTLILEGAVVRLPFTRVHSVCEDESVRVKSDEQFEQMNTWRFFLPGSGWVRTLAIIEESTVSSSEGRRGGGGGLLTEYTMAVGGKVGMGTRIMRGSFSSSISTICSCVKWLLTRSCRSRGSWKNNVETSKCNGRRFYNILCSIYEIQSWKACIVKAELQHCSPSCSVPWKKEKKNQQGKWIRINDLHILLQDHK
jgi:hypothetical protein